MALHTFNALVVDDDSIARRTVGFALAQEGFNCAYAFDGDHALDRLASEQFDLVVTDLSMPNINGHSLAVELLSRKQPPLIIVHSSIDDPQLTKELMLRGVDDIVYKPTNYAAFAAKARGLVIRRKQVAEEQIVVTTALHGTSADDHTRPTAPDLAWVITSPQVSPISLTENEHRLDNTHHLSPVSTAVHEVVLLSTREETTLQELVARILQDRGLTAEVLRVANDVNYSRNRGTTNDVEEALMRIGFKKVGEIALTLNSTLEIPPS